MSLDSLVIRYIGVLLLLYFFFYKNESEDFTSIAYFLITIFISFVHELLDVIVGNWLFNIILQLYSQEMFYFTETQITIS